MSRRNKRNRGADQGRLKAARRGSRSSNRGRLGIERLEERNLLAVDPLQLFTSDLYLGESADGASIEAAIDRTIYTSPAYSTSLVAPTETMGSGSASNLLEAAPFPLEQTFSLHSRPGATKTIYLDFDGHTTRNTQWNTDFEIPNIVTPAFTLDGDSAFSDQELEVIQFIWERVAEDFRPFDVNVTTEEPPLTDLIRTGGTDVRWGQRVAIGGTNQDWLFDDGVGGIAYGSFTWDSDTPTFVFNVGEKATAETISHEVGHTLGLGHDGQIVPPTEEEPEPPPLDYYGGHGPDLPMGLMGWGPIMGAPFNKNLTQWSIGEYPLATNTQDDLAIITTGNGFGYIPDIHGDTRATASILGFTSAEFFDEGVIERNTDVDYFQFTIGNFGETVTFDINPFHRGPNLDILATIYNSSGVVIAESNPVDDLYANFELTLTAGTYFLAIEGTGRPQTAAGDFGYTDYGSLGYYSIVGTRKELLVGVDFDLPGGAVPTNWTRYTGNPTPAVLTDLKNEANFTTPFNLAINTGGAPITRTANTINGGTIPSHAQPLDNLGGFLSSSSWSFTWSDLTPSTAYEVFVFGLSNAAGMNNVQIVGAGLIDFVQTLSTNDLIINDEIGSSSGDTSSLGLTVLSSSSGTIEITVTPESGVASLGGLAIRPGKLGAIEGQKWNDENGDGIKDSTEPGLEGWTIFLDENGNGVWDTNAPQTAASVDVPQVLVDHTTIKSELLFSGFHRIEDVDITLNITHTYTGDIDAYLISPSGTRVELFTDVGVFGANFSNTTLDDEGPIGIAAGVPPYTGSFRPEGFLSAFDGEDPNGVWILEITDDALENTGVLNSWSLSITGSEIATVTDAEGNYSFEEMTPGVYHVHEVQQPGWTQTFAAPEVRLNSGARVQDVDFGNWIPVTLPGSIQGQKWEDLNEDGIKDPGELGLEGWVIFLDANGNGVLDASAPETVASTDAPKTITDFSTVISQLTFDGFGSVQDVNVTLDITHSFAADLDAYLIGPSGRQVKLFTGVGGQYNDFQNTTLDDGAATAITDAEAPFMGSFRPEGLLSDFNGENPNGTWQLLIRDTDLGDEGTLIGWSLTIVTTEQSTVTDENGNYAFIDVAPGTYFVHEVPQAGWVQTAPVIPTGKTSWEIVVDSDTAVTEIDFGNVAADFLPGDYNLDGMVDAADYAVWRDARGSSVTPFTGADGNGDGFVDEADRIAWKTNFGSSLPASATALVVSQALETTPESSDLSVEAAAGETFAPASPTVAAPSSVREDAFHQPRVDRSASLSSPTSDRADAALLAWLASLPNSIADRIGSRDAAFDGCDFADESTDSKKPIRERVELSLVTALDRAFASLGV